MALIRCPDCGRAVSDLAVACPDCARPIASLRDAEAEKVASGMGRKRLAKTARPVVALASPPASATTPEAPLPPRTRAWKEEVLAAKASTGTKVCSRCGQDVTLDVFRQKVGEAYVCADCQDMQMARARRRAILARKALFVAAIVAVLSVVICGILYVASNPALWQTPAKGKTK